MPDKPNYKLFEELKKNEIWLKTIEEA